MLRLRLDSRGVIFAIVVACSLWAVGPARADDDEYESIIRSALTEYEAGRYEEATALFARAHAMQPSARTHRGLGLAYFEARRYSLAVVHLKAALADQRLPLTAEQRTSAQKVLRDASQFVAQVRVQFEPSGAVLEVDGHAPDRDGEMVLLDAGRHELTTSADGYLSDRRTIDARAAEALSLHVALSAAAVPGNVSEQPASASAEPLSVPAAIAAAREPAGVGAGPFIVLGAGAALLAGAGVTWLVANNAHDDVERACPDHSCKSQSYQDDVSRGKTFVAATNVLLLAGVVGLAAGSGYFWLASRDHSAPQLNAACNGKGCGVALRGAF